MPTHVPAPARRLRFLLPLVLLLVWLVLGGALGPFAGKLGEVSTNDGAAFLPRSAESTRVSQLEKDFRAESTLPVVLVWEARSGQVDEALRADAGKALAEAARVPGTTGQPSPLLPSEDGKALE